MRAGDVRCGVVYVDYFARCASAVRGFFPTQYSAFQRLDQTCTEVGVQTISLTLRFSSVHQSLERVSQ